jgi:hypothetical protein
MPLVKGKSDRAVSKNIGTLVGDFEKKGRIGTSKPASRAAAAKQATAIALQKAGRAKPRKYSNGGFINEPTNYEVRPGVNYVEQLTREEKERAQASSGQGTATSRERQAQEAEERPRFTSPLSMPGAGPGRYPASRTVRPNVKFFPEEYDVARNRTPPREAKMKTGGRVSAKKGR